MQTIVGPGLAHRKAAYDEIKKCTHCSTTTVCLQLIPFQKLDFGETNFVDLFCSADLAIIDLSIQDQQNSLLYHLGVRESFGMKQNILIFNDLDASGALHVKLTCSNYTLITYKLNEAKQCVALDTPANLNEPRLCLGTRMRKLMQEIEVQSK